MSAEAIIWTDEELPLDVTSKAILSKLALVSDMEDCAWMCVATLAKRVGASERTVQSRLRKLEGREEGDTAYIRATGRFHRYGTRNVPIYELLVDHDLVAEVQATRKDRKRAEAERRAKPLSMGATVCTHSPEPGEADDTVCTPMGATACTPNEANRESEFANAHSERGRGREGAVERAAGEILAAWPTGQAQHSSPREVATALRGEVRRGLDLTSVVAACLAYAAKPKAWGKSGDAMAPHNLIASGRWETHAGGGLGPRGSARQRTGFAGPATMRAQFVADFGEAKALSILDPCGWRDADGVLLARTGHQLTWLRDHKFKVERAVAQAEQAA